MLLNRHAQSVMHLMGPGRNPATDTVPGLPRVPGGRNPRRGATQTHLNPANRPALIDVAAQPSMKIIPHSNGSVQVVLKRNARSAEFMTRAEYGILQRIMNDIKHDAEKMSQGPLSLKELRRRGHPYGRGGRRGRIARSGRAGVPSLAIVNKQSGKFAAAWSVDIKKGKTGADFILSNSSDRARRLAEGTAKMKAHGPFSTAFTRHLHKLDTAWRQAAKAAYLRERAVEAHHAGNS